MSKIILVTDPMQINKELAQIRKESRQLSGYTDQDYGYSGSGFAEARTEAVVKHVRKQLMDFKFSITNSGSGAINRIIALTSPFGYNEAQLADAGHIVAGVLRTGQVVPGAAVGVDDVTAYGSRANRPIELLTKYSQENPLRVVGITISSDNMNAFETDLQIVQLNPFKQEEERTIDLSNYLRADNLTGKKIEADLVNDGLDFSMDNQTLIKWFIPADVSAIITLRFGGMLNMAAKFDTNAMMTTVSAQTKLAAMGSGGKTSAISSIAGKL